MGWIYTGPVSEGHDTEEDHEGFTVARDHDMKEIHYPTKTANVYKIGAGCECGWRSMCWIPAWGASWHPYLVDVAPEEEDRAYRLWRGHLERACGALPMKEKDSDIPKSTPR